MPITYTWTINTLIGYPLFEGQTDVVTRVNYTITGDDGEGHTADYTNWQPTPLDPSVPFIPYDELTPEIITGWVQSSLGPDRVTAIEESIAIDIQRQVTPPPEPQVFPLPWAPPVPPTPPPPFPEPVDPTVPSIPEPIAPPAPDLSAPTN